MIYINSQPRDLTPINEGVIFEVESDEVADFTIDIVDAITEKVVGTKVIKGVQYAKVDIAPYIENMVSVAPSWAENCQLKDIDAASYYISVATEDDSAVSEPIMVSCNRDAVVINDIYSEQAAERTIGYGECDDICFVSLPNATIVAKVTSSTGQQRSIELHSKTGISQLHISTAEFSRGAEWLKIELFVDDNLEQSMRYTIVPRYGGAVRVVWLSEGGMPERFTLPATLSKSRVVERKSLFTNKIMGEMVSCKSVNRIVLRSQLLTESEADFLSTILCSPRVWLELADGVVEAKPLETEMVTSSFGRLVSAEFTFEYGGKEVLL